MFGVLLAKLRILPRRPGSVFGGGTRMRELARSGFPADGLWSARPGRELGAQRGDILLAEPVAGELLVADAVELAAGFGVIVCGQAGIEAAGEADQLRRAVAVQDPRGVGVARTSTRLASAQTLPPATSSSASTGPSSMTTGARLRSK